LVRQLVATSLGDVSGVALGVAHGVPAAGAGRLASRQTAEDEVDAARRFDACGIGLTLVEQWIGETEVRVT
jgi:hypothetical protein